MRVASEEAIRIVQAEAHGAGSAAGARRATQARAACRSRSSYSDPLRIRLDSGSHTLTLRLTPSDENMNRAVNEALLDHVRLTWLGE